MAQISLIFVFISVISVNQRPIFLGNAHGNTPVEHRVYGRAAGDEWIEDLFVDQVYLDWKHIKLARGVFPSGFRDHELRQLSMPTLLLEGEQTPAYSAQSAIDRARELIPQIQAEIIAGAGGRSCCRSLVAAVGLGALVAGEVCHAVGERSER
jgi:pimeloyl-ACP methyl ester carboxylesterase